MFGRQKSLVLFLLLMLGIGFPIARSKEDLFARIADHIVLNLAKAEEILGTESYSSRLVAQVRQRIFASSHAKAPYKGTIIPTLDEKERANEDTNKEQNSNTSTLSHFLSTLTPSATSPTGHTSGNSFAGTGEEKDLPLRHPLPDGFRNLSYCERLLLKDNAGLAFTLVEGELPPGLQISSDLGRICGVPSELGSFLFALQISTATGNFESDLAKDIDSLAGEKIIFYSLNISEKKTETDREGKLQITSTILPNALVGVTYFFQLQAQGGKAPYIWSISGLPQGFSSNPILGTIVGDPSVSGTHALSIQVTDTAGEATSLNLPFEIQSSELQISTSSLHSTEVGLNYTERLTAQGGFPPYTWQLVNGALPSGLQLEPKTGLIFGTPLAPYEGLLTIAVTDSQKAYDSAAFSLKVLSQELRISTTKINPGVVGENYNVILQATGGTPPYSWKLDNISSAQASPISLLTGGLLTGLLTEPGPISIVVQVTDTAGKSAKSSLNLEVLASPLRIVTSSIPALPICSPYSEQLSAEGGTPPYTWNLISTSTDAVSPKTLTLSATGLLSFYSTTDYTANLTVQVIDAAGQNATQALVLAANADELKLKTSKLLSCEAKSSCSFSLTGLGGCPPLKFSLDSFDPRCDIALDGTGVLTTDCAQVGEYALSVTIQDEADRKTSVPLTLQIHASDFHFSTNSLPEAQSAVPYDTLMSVTGGTPPYRFQYDSALPAGLSLYALEGALRGTPEEDGDFQIAITAFDALGARASKSFSLTIKPSPLFIPSETLEMPLITTNEPFQHSLVAKGGHPPYSWAFIDQTANGNNTVGALSGLRISDSVLFGTISVAQTGLTGLLKVKDNNGEEVSADIHFAVTGGKLSIISPSSLEAAIIGKPYREELAASGGLPPYTWNIISGSLPIGLEIEATSGMIAGTTGEVAIDAQFVVEVQDQLEQTSSASLLISVTGNKLAPITQLIAAPSNAKVGLSWENPRSSGFQEAVILRNDTHYPQTTKDGWEIYRGPNDNYLDTNLENNQTYFYAAFASYPPTDDCPDGMSEAPQTARAYATTTEVSLNHHPDPFVDEVVDYSPLDRKSAFNASALPGIVLGPPQARNGGISMGGTDVVSLGSRANTDHGKSAPYGGSITVRFTDNLIYDGPGPDFIVFENPMRIQGSSSAYFIEPAIVEVSANGRDFFRIPFDFVPHLDQSGNLNLSNPSCYSRGFAGVRPVLSNNGYPDPTDPAVAGGDPFDLADLPGRPLTWIQYVRIIATGDNWLIDSTGDAVRQTSGGAAEALSGVKSSGFDLDAIASVHY